MLDNKWQMIVSRADFAFMPIVNVFTGVVFAFEVYLRNFEFLGFDSIGEFFDLAYNDKVLYEVDLNLRKKAILKFVETGYSNRTLLFYNLDTRIYKMDDYGINNTKMLLAKYNLPAESFCFEIMEQSDLELLDKSQDLLQRYKQNGLNVALDNFSLSLAGSKLLYNCPPQFLKVDAPYLQALYDDSKQRELVINTFDIANKLHIKVVATEVESEDQFLLCKELGCNLIEGFLIQEPVVDISLLKTKYEIIENITALHHKVENARNDRSLLYNQMHYLEPALVDMNLLDVFNYFRRNTDSTFMPVVNRTHIPIGILKEKTLKSFAYSLYGKEVLMNTDKTVRDFTSSNPSCDINTKIDQIITIFSENDEAEGVLITENMTYIGFLSARAMLKVINERNLREALNHNPLTSLPGNKMIDEYMERLIVLGKENTVFVYLDFDSFKPFNDYYGFNSGDKAISLFADILRSKPSLKDAFIGHVGGDDFFVGMHGHDFSEVLLIIQDIIDTFSIRARALYTDEDREKGYIYSKDREGNVKKFDLLGVSAAVIMLPKKKVLIQADTLGKVFSNLKKTAKMSPTHIAAVSCL